MHYRGRPTGIEFAHPPTCLGRARPSTPSGVGFEAARPARALMGGGRRERRHEEEERSTDGRNVVGWRRAPKISGSAQWVFSIYTKLYVSGSGSLG